MTRESPPVKDSDIIWLCIKKLEAVATKMQNLEYDEKLDALMSEASQWFDWAAFNIAGRNGLSTIAGDIDIDPFERAATIAETLTGHHDQPATPEAIATAIRAWSKRTNPVSETIREEVKKL